MKKITLFLFFLFFFYSSFIHAKENDTLSIETKNTIYIFRRSSFSNLVYHVNCLADLEYGTHEAYIKLWKEKLNWNKEDSIQIQEWKSIIQKNDTTVFSSINSVELNNTYIFNFPTALYLPEKIILEGIKSRI